MGRVRRPPGRPRLPDGERKVRLAICVDPELADAFRRRAALARQSVSVFLRESILLGGLPSPVPAINYKAHTALSTALSNINQLAHHANAAVLAGRLPDNLSAVPAALADLRCAVADIRAQLIDDRPRE